VIEHVARTLGLVPADYVQALDYPRFPAQGQVVGELRKWMDQVHGAMAAALDGDVAVIFDQKWATHTALLAHQGPCVTMIHATARERRVVEHVMDEDWRRRGRAIFRFRGIAGAGGTHHNGRGSESVQISPA
jgi:hypothetical protein